MQNILAIWQREIKSYFVSPIAYVVLTVFLFITGFFFFGYVAQLSTAQMGQIQQAIDVPGIVITGSVSDHQRRAALHCSYADDGSVCGGKEARNN